MGVITITPLKLKQRLLIHTLPRVGKAVSCGLEDSYPKEPKGRCDSVQESIVTSNALSDPFQVDMEPSSSPRVTIWFPREAAVRCEQLQKTQEAAESGTECWLLRVSATPHGETKLRKGSVWRLPGLTSQAAGSHCEVRVQGCPRSCSICTRCRQNPGKPTNYRNSALMWNTSRDVLRDALSGAVRKVPLQTC